MNTRKTGVPVLMSELNFALSLEINAPEIKAFCREEVFIPNKVKTKFKSF